MSDRKDLRWPRGADGLTALRQIPRPPTLNQPEARAPLYQPDPPLVGAVEAALVLGVPLLVTGEPGVGKTQVAFWLGLYFNIPVFELQVKSSTTFRDLLYTFDTVAYFHQAQEKGVLDKEDFIAQGPLWKAYATQQRSVVLIDEIDKAPRDFPNDLLRILEDNTFVIPELNRTESLKPGVPPPIWVVTSNGERQLPLAFLRRCIFHNIELTQELVARAVEAHGPEYSHLGADILALAQRRFFELRSRDLRKKPGTAELLMWLVLLNLLPPPALQNLGSLPLAQLPHLGVLIKDGEDLKSL